MEWYITYPVVLLAGMLAGFINTLAGSGSIFSLLALNMAGLPLNIANATNRVGIFFQTLVGVHEFKKQGQLHIRKEIRIAIPIVIGSFIGSYFASYAGGQLLRHIIAGVLFIILLSLIFNGKRWTQGKVNQDNTLKTKWWHYIMYLGIGIYGGFIQLGVGVFMLTSLVMLSGLNLLKANAVKVLTIFFLTGIAIIMFAIHGLIIWDLGIVMAIGNGLGAWFATKEAVKRGAGFIRWLMIVVVTFAVIHYSGLIY